jgi:hypothetical protein
MVQMVGATAVERVCVVACRASPRRVSVKRVGATARGYEALVSAKELDLSVCEQMARHNLLPLVRFHPRAKQRVVPVGEVGAYHGA